MNTSKTMKWMRRHVGEYVDDCFEINCTRLAEDCAIELYDRAATEDEFECAFEASEEYDAVQCST